MLWFRTYDEERLGPGLAHWSWAAPSTPLEPKFISPFADVFFAAPSGAVWHLSPVTGELVEAWPSHDALKAELETEDGADHYLNSVWAQAAERRGLRLSEWDAYAFSPPPQLGGFDVANITVMDAGIALTMTGQLHERLRTERDGDDGPDE